MKKRTFGWIQNPGDLKKLKKVVSIFMNGSETNLWLRNERLPLLKQYGLISQPDFIAFTSKTSQVLIEIEYASLKGKGSGSASRADALCTGIIQAVIDGQKNKTYSDNNGNTITIKKPYTDDWSAEGYLRWAISCGLLEYVESSDTCKITDLGKELAGSLDDSPEEKEALSKALLSYPPVIRILSLLKDKDKQSKFELGSQLGFKEELGFTSIPQAMYLCDYCEASESEKKEIRSNSEGDSDKYARGIASWCAQMGWVTTDNEEKSGMYRGKQYTATLQVFSITRAGEKALTKANGYSSNPRIKRVVMFEMLASNRAPGADYLRYERACILKALTASDKTLEQIKKFLKDRDVDISEAAIRDHIDGLISIGLDIKASSNKYKLLDKIIGLDIPNKNVFAKVEANEIKEKIREKLITVNHKYLILVDLAYSDASSTAKKNADAKEFEIQTAELFVDELGFSGKRLGDSNRPDVIISYDTFGTIIDNKSYKDGFNVDRGCRDEMARYVNENQQRIPGVPANEWWKEFDSRVVSFTFLFVTSYLKGKFTEQLEYISNTHSGTKGGAINVENLLYLAESIKAGEKTKESFFNDFNNDEMIYK